MIIDERTYTTHPGRLGEFIGIYETYGKAIQWSHLGDPVGWFTTDIGTLNQVVHLWRYEDYADRQRRRAAMQADPGWGTYLAKAAPCLMRMENRILVPTAFSPLR